MSRAPKLWTRSFFCSWVSLAGYGTSSTALEMRAFAMPNVRIRYERERNKKETNASMEPGLPRILVSKWRGRSRRSCTRGFESHGGHHCGAWPLTDPGVEAERAVPEVLYSSRSWHRSGEGVAELKSKRRGRRGAEVP